MFTVTKKDFQNWIKAQPNERPVDMEECIVEHAPCGCVMIQYGRDKKFGSFSSCGFREWRKDGKDIAVFDGGLSLCQIILEGIHNKSKTFGELKEQLI